MIIVSRVSIGNFLAADCAECYAESPRCREPEMASDRK